MRTLKQVLIATAILGGTLFTINTNAVAGNNDMRQACNENQSAGANRQKCYDRYGLGTAPIFRDEKRRYYDGHIWFEPNRPQYYSGRRYHQERRYIGEESRNNEFGIVIGGMYLLQQLLQQRNTAPASDCQEYIVLDRYGNEQYVCQ